MTQKTSGRYRPRRARGHVETHYLLTYILLPIIPTALLGLYFLFRGNQAVMEWMIQHITNPYKRGISWLVDWIPFSVAELCYGIAIVGGIAYLVRTIALLILRPGKLLRLVRRVVVLGSVVLILYTGFTLLWGINFYGTSFSEKTGLVDRGASAEELYQLTIAFADKANQLSDSVARDEEGLFCEEPGEIFDQSETIFAGISEEYPFLTGYSRTPKPMVTSRMFSYMGFTGFYFPFTGESTLNMNPPACLLPATVAHELSHQRGVANEDEANFTAILTCLRSDNPVYQYSGCLMAYIHLSNALYEADKEFWREAAGTVNQAVWADLDSNNTYWKEISSTSAGSTATEVSSSLYTTFASGYGQEDVMQRYGACVDLLVAYYFDQ